MRKQRTNIFDREVHVKFRKLNKTRNSFSLASIKPSQNTTILPPFKNTPRKSQLPALQEQPTPQPRKQLAIQPLAPIHVQSTLKEEHNQEYQEQLCSSLKKLNFRHHNEQNCLCSYCECGRHVCKFSVIRPQFNKRSSYQMQYSRKRALSQSVLLIAKDAALLKSDSLVKMSAYNKEFIQHQAVKSQLQRGHDHLKLSGPSQTLTSYKNQFTSKLGVNQYVKHTDRHTIGASTFVGKTTYGREFNGKAAQRHQSFKVSDNIKSGGIWIGQSSYKLKFQNTKASDYSKINTLMSRSEKVLKNIDFSGRFKTSYKNEFLEKKTGICPAHKHLHESPKCCRHIINLLNEQSDCKGMNPEFKTIATSKHCFV